MKKVIIWLLITVALGGGFYYLMNYDKNNPQESDFIESTQEFINDGIEKIDEGVKKGKEIIKAQKDTVK